LRFRKNHRFDIESNTCGGKPQRNSTRQYKGFCQKWQTGEGAKMGEDAEIEIAARVIEDLLYRVAPEKRAAAIARAAEVEQASRERWSRGSMRASDMGDDWMRYWHDVQSFKARVAYTFIRSIRNNHSPDDAATILFGMQGGCPGSGCLSDYIDDLPRD
jgi:hypothetical protein